MTVARLDPRGARSLQAFARAAVASRAVRVRFVDTERSLAERTLDVVALAFEPPRWVVATWSRDLRSLRLLDLARIRRVVCTRRHAGPPPPGFDALDFSARHLLDPDGGQPRDIVLRIDGRLARLAPALLPTARVERDSLGGWRCRVRASRPAVVAAIADSLEMDGAIHSRAPMHRPSQSEVEHRGAPPRPRLLILSQSEPDTRDELENAVRKLVVGARGLPPRASAAEDLVVQGEPVKQKTLDKLVGAWERRKRIAISYWRPSSGEVVEREIDVYGWARRRGEWIFVGWCHLRKGVRIFYLSRLRALKVNTRGDKSGDYQIPRDFDVRRWSRQEIWDDDVHAPTEATVRFRGSLARIARQLLPSAKVSTAEDGARVAKLGVRNLRGLVRQALAWGPEAELVTPEEGRAMAREILAGLAATTERRAS